MDYSLLLGVRHHRLHVDRGAIYADIIRGEDAATDEVSTGECLRPVGSAWSGFTPQHIVHAWQLIYATLYTFTVS